MAFFVHAAHQLDLLVFVVKIASAEFMTWTNKYLILIGSSVSCYSMLMSSCSSGCKCGSSCVNKPFQQRPMKKMKTVLVTLFFCYLNGDDILLNLAFLRDRYAILTFSSSASICLLINATFRPDIHVHFHIAAVQILSIVACLNFSKLKCLFQTEKCGMGVVAEEDINQGEFVIEYVGEVIDDKTCEERLWKMKHSGETNFYLCEINRDMVIDATYKGNKSRYINHSCSPNTEMQKWMIDGETRIGIFATRDIKKGEHLTYDYQFVQFGADQDCYCGAAGCRKKLGVKPNKPKAPFSDAALRIAASQMDANSPEVKAVVSNKPIMFEDGYSEFLDLAKEEWEFCNC
ncbi:UNVERIFIED_CONTAM: Histone-lysine N-methyltransferase ASHH3 [Sesamum calycinum]|uniref:Histone-lysine N-methyltransferase ASHH3 n=1 Tax=Sesamum calycinum TaxID=2727403 RepID=A0AAW2IYV7_9LAMI